MAPWRLWRSVPTVMGRSFGRTGPNKEERARDTHHTHYCLGNRSSDIVYLFLPYNQELEGSGCGALYWRAHGSCWKKRVTNWCSHTFIRGTFWRREAYKNVPIPVVDLHGYQMVYDCLGVLWETSYVDTDNTIVSFS